MNGMKSGKVRFNVFVTERQKWMLTEIAATTGLSQAELVKRFMRAVLDYETYPSFLNELFPTRSGYLSGKYIFPS